MEAEGENRALAIFWDLESCPIPAGLIQADIATRIVAALRVRVPDASSYDLKEFLAYGDPDDFPDHLLQTWDRDSMKLLDAGKGYHLYKRMIDGIMGFAFDRVFSPRRSSMMVVISAAKWPESILWYLKTMGLGPGLVIPSDSATPWDVELGLTTEPWRLLSNDAVDSLLARLDKDKAEREAKKMKMTLKPTDDGKTSCPISPREPAQMIGTTAFFWCEYGVLSSADQLHGLFSSLYRYLPFRLRPGASWLLVVGLDDCTKRGFEKMCVEGYDNDNQNTASEPDQNHPNESSQPVCEDEDEDEETDFDKALIHYGCSYGYCPPLKGYSAYWIMLSKVLYFVHSYRPPATIVFISGNPEFGPLLVRLRRMGYNMITISSSEDAVPAFKEAGLVLYDWGAVSRGEGFFPVGA